jgi:hypothetical protein
MYSAEFLKEKGLDGSLLPEKEIVELFKKL